MILGVKFGRKFFFWGGGGYTGGRAKQVPFAKKALLCRPCLCPNPTKQSSLAKIHLFTRSQNLEGKSAIFTVLKWGKGQNHYENHDLDHNH